VILCGIQGSGKTTLYRDRFLETHVRISLDLLRTRHREARFFETCLQTRQPFVVDKTNETVEERRRYVAPAKEAGYRLVAYLVEIDSAEALARNALRPSRRQVPIAGVLGTRKRLAVPTAAEGFDEIHRARPRPGGGWLVEPLELSP